MDYSRILQSLLLYLAVYNYLSYITLYVEWLLCLAVDSKIVKRKKTPEGNVDLKAIDAMKRKQILPEFEICVTLTIMLQNISD